MNNKDTNVNSKALSESELENVSGGGLIDWFRSLLRRNPEDQWEKGTPNRDINRRHPLDNN